MRTFLLRQPPDPVTGDFLGVWARVTSLASPCVARMRNFAAVGYEGATRGAPTETAQKCYGVNMDDIVDVENGRVGFQFFALKMG